MRIPLTALCACVLLTVGAAARAAPAGTEPEADPMLQLLQQRSVAAAGQTGALMREVRDSASNLVGSALHFLGTPYRRGGTSADRGFDCSGFTRHVFNTSLGLVLPHRAEEQAGNAALAKVGRDDLKPGDLVFFNTMRRAFSHVGIYIGNGRFIHSPRSGSRVRVDDMRQSYWTKRFNGARRAEVLATSDAQP